MSNHIHYLIEPQKSEDIPKIMHYINWYSAMCFNRMLNRTGHFWEKRYHSTSFPNTDIRRGLNTIRYIHANPQTAGMQKGFFYDFSNYGVYERLDDDGLTTWHPAFLPLRLSAPPLERGFFTPPPIGTSPFKGRMGGVEECATKYRKFCYQYQPPEKSTKKFYWGSRLLPKLTRKNKKTTTKKKATEKQKKAQEEAKKLYQYWQENNPEIVKVAEKFILANCYNPDYVEEYLANYY